MIWEKLPLQLSDFRPLAPGVLILCYVPRYEGLHGNELHQICKSVISSNKHQMSPILPYIRDYLDHLGSHPWDWQGPHGLKAMIGSLTQDHTLKIKWSDEFIRHQYSWTDELLGSKQVLIIIYESLL